MMLRFVFKPPELSTTALNHGLHIESVNNGTDSDVVRRMGNFK